LNGADLSEADLGGANLSQAELNKAHFVGVDLMGADLGAADLAGSDFGEADLTLAKMVGANLDHTTFGKARLSRANLSGCDLTQSDLNGADLRGANLSGANLTEVNLSGADLSGANLSGANLTGANLTRAKLVSVNLRDTNLQQVRLWETVFIGVDLSTVKGLETINHLGPSHIGLDTVYLTKSHLPVLFLRGCGVPENFIAVVQALGPAEKNYDYCAISFANKDEPFAKRLHKDLTSAGVRCWLATEDMKAGERFRIRIEEAIKVYHRIVLVLSEHSMASSWIDGEVEAALERERAHGAPVLYPVRLDASMEQSKQTAIRDLLQARRIHDMTNWRSEQNYQAALAELLRELNFVPTDSGVR
jgi:hypothetical protein